MSGRPPVQPVVLPIASSTCDAATIEACPLPHLGRLVGKPVVSAQGCEATLELHTLDNAATCAVVVKDGRRVTVVDTLSTCQMYDQSAKPNDRVELVRVDCSGVELTIGINTKPSSSFSVRCNASACTRLSDQAWESFDGQARAHTGLDDFLGNVEDTVAAHDWKKLLSLASSGHKHTQLVEVKQDEPTYLAELLGVHTVGNSIAKDHVTLADLESIRSIEVAEVFESENPHDTEITGLVHLMSGATLHLYMAVVKEDDHFVLTGGVG
jgi:hypothetical protein